MREKKKGEGPFSKELFHRRIKRHSGRQESTVRPRVCVFTTSVVNMNSWCVFFSLAQGVLLWQPVCISVTLWLYVLHYVWLVAGIEVQYMGTVQGRRWKCVLNLTPHSESEFVSNMCSFVLALTLPTAAVEPVWLFSWDSRCWFDNWLPVSSFLIRLDHSFMVMGGGGAAGMLGWESPVHRRYTSVPPLLSGVHNRLSYNRPH